MVSLGHLLTKWTLFVIILSVFLHLRETQGQSSSNKFLSSTLKVITVDSMEVTTADNGHILTTTEAPVFIDHTTTTTTIDQDLPVLPSRTILLLSVTTDTGQEKTALSRSPNHTASTTTTTTSTTDQELPVLPSRTIILSVTADTGQEKTALSLSLSPRRTASVIHHDVTNIVTTMVDDNSEFEVTRSSGLIGTVAFVGLLLALAIIAILVPALVCLVRRYKKLKRELNRCMDSGGGNCINNSMETILNESAGSRGDHVIVNNSTGEDHVTSAIPMEENIAYNRNDGYEYVLNELVYASIDECNGLPQDSPVSNAYLDILDN